MRNRSSSSPVAASVTRASRPPEIVFAARTGSSAFKTSPRTARRRSQAAERDASKAFSKSSESGPRREKPLLSDREKEIVQLVAQGFRNKEIGEKLFISEQTVKNHLHNIFDKLGVSDRLELALYAIHHRLIDQA